MLAFNKMRFVSIGVHDVSCDCFNYFYIAAMNNSLRFI